MTQTEKNILNRLDELFPDRNLLSAKDVVDYTGWSYPTVQKKFKMDKGKRIDKVYLASLLAGGAV